MQQLISITRFTFYMLAMLAALHTTAIAQMVITPEERVEARKKMRLEDMTAWDAINYLQTHAPHLLKMEVPLNVDTVWMLDTVRITDTVCPEAPKFTDTLWFGFEPANTGTGAVDGGAGSGYEVIIKNTPGAVKAREVKEPVVPVLDVQELRSRVKIEPAPVRNTAGEIPVVQKSKKPDTFTLDMAILVALLLFAVPAVAYLVKRRRYGNKTDRIV